MIPAEFTNQYLFSAIDVNIDRVRHWWKNNATPEDQEVLIERGFQYWRERGFPFPEKSRGELAASLQRLISTDPDSALRQGDEIAQSSVGVGVCNSYHSRKMYAVRCNGFKSVLEHFDDDSQLRKAVKKCFSVCGMCNDASIIAMLRTGGAQAPSNFPPFVAKWIYKNFAPRHGYILDPSAGWGGRVLGALCTPHRRYIGIDPHEAAVLANREMVQDVLSLRRDITTAAELVVGCAEDVIPTYLDDTFDLIFTSPPYFDVEKYDTESTQSYLKHGSGGYDAWLEGFLRPVIRQCARVVRDSGWVMFNVSWQIRKQFNFGEDTVRIAQEEGLELAHTYNVRFMLRTQLRGKQDSKHRLEPLFLLKRKGTPECPFPSREKIDKSPFQLF